MIRLRSFVRTLPFCTFLLRLFRVRLRSVLDSTFDFTHTGYHHRFTYVLHHTRTWFLRTLIYTVVTLYALLISFYHTRLIHYIHRSRVTTLRAFSHFRSVVPGRFILPLPHGDVLRVIIYPFEFVIRFHYVDPICSVLHLLYGIRTTRFPCPLFPLPDFTFRLPVTLTHTTRTTFTDSALDVPLRVVTTFIRLRLIVSPHTPFTVIRFGCDCPRIHTLPVHLILLRDPHTHVTVPTTHPYCYPTHGLTHVAGGSHSHARLPTTVTPFTRSLRW